MPTEQFRYKGNFEFIFSPTNQTILGKTFIKRVFPPDAIKKARGKKIENFDRELVWKRVKDIKDKLAFFKPCMITAMLEDEYEKNPESVILYYLILNDALKTITYPVDFDVELDLAQSVLFGTINRQVRD